MKVALIDDSKVVREDFKQAFEYIKSGDLKIYEFGEEFILDLIEEKENFDVVFLDGTILNGTSSEQILKKIKEKKIDAKVLVFGGIQLEEVSKWINLGADGFISKPLDREQLKKKLKELEK